MNVDESCLEKRLEQEEIWHFPTFIYVKLLASSNLYEASLQVAKLILSAHLNLTVSDCELKALAKLIKHL